MKKVVIAFLTLGVLIPMLFIVMKITFSPKKAGPIPQTSVSTEKRPTGPAPAEVSPKYKTIAGPQLLPVDEGTKIDSFNSFREQLATAVKNKDFGFLKQHIDENIKYSFGENSGLAGFFKEWNLDKDPVHSGFWTEIDRVIRLGGSFDSRNAFVAPYVFARFPETVDSFVYLAVVDKNVQLHVGPDAKSEVLGLLNYNLVQAVEFDRAQAWQKVSAGENAVGYVQTQYVRSAVDYRAYFENKGGEWKIVFFVAGD